jgi:hypothetical protein
MHNECGFFIFVWTAALGTDHKSRDAEEIWSDEGVNGPKKREKLC